MRHYINKGVIHRYFFLKNSCKAIINDLLCYSDLFIELSSFGLIRLFILFIIQGYENTKPRGNFLFPHCKVVNSEAWRKPTKKLDLSFKINSINLLLSIALRCTYLPTIFKEYSVELFHFSLRLNRCLLDSSLIRVLFFCYSRHTLFF